MPKSNLSGQTVIVTGANVGLGFEAAKHLARMGASNIILGCRDVKKGEYAAAVVARTPGAEKAQVEVWPLDLGSYSSVEKFASRAEALPRLDSVIQNAGILTANFNLMEGNEEQFARQRLQPDVSYYATAPQAEGERKTEQERWQSDLCGLRDVHVG